MNNVGPDIPVRVHALRGSVEEVAVALEERYPGSTVERVAWYDHALIVRGMSKQLLANDPLVVDGVVYLQGLASMLPARVLDPQPGECILDMCAAPGGKTLMIADLMRDEGEIVANDASRTRLFKLTALLERYGVTCVKTNCSKGEFLWRTYTNSFDRVLVDAPCSMDLPRSARERKALARQQTYLLRSALACVAPGGRVVYATCTSAHEENEGVVSWILEHVAGVQLDPIVPMQGVPVTAEGHIRIEQGSALGPFFVARFVRLD